MGDDQHEGDAVVYRERKRSRIHLLFFSAIVGRFFI